MTTDTSLPAAPAAPTTRVPRVLSVGQCGFDHRNLSNFFKRLCGAETVSIDTLDDAIEALRQGSFALVLVNRVLEVDGSSGLDLVRALKGQDDPRVATVPVMLVSNYPDVRRQAEALGALPGFGKADLAAPKADLLDRLKTVLGSA